MDIIIILTTGTAHHEIQDSLTDQEPLNLLKINISGLSYGLFTVAQN